MFVSPLLEKTRLINSILQKSSGRYIDFYEISQVLSEVIQSHVYIIDLLGNILGYKLTDQFECNVLIENVVDKGRFPERYNGFLLKSDELRYNLKHKKPFCVYVEEMECSIPEKYVTIIPIIGGGRRMGTLLLARYDNLFVEDDLILAERGAAVVGMEFLREETDRLEEEARHRAVVKLAVGTLSYSEMEAVEQMFKTINSDEGFLVASKIADEIGITRSVIVNALRKLESAGVLESRSLGMKGTYIKVLNPFLFEHLG
ncbi:MAG TPA: GTP-sensing pleiotropic transcriptional regulator CodY [Firmicutes bacterium]|jgi:transcriptional pleiotropic repressor|nr:GTP-sensing pleiotropic transcriptional regulator CodY [Bacillota bacterium]